MERYQVSVVHCSHVFRFLCQGFLNSLAIDTRSPQRFGFACPLYPRSARVFDHGSKEAGERETPAGLPHAGRGLSRQERVVEDYQEAAGRARGRSLGLWRATKLLGASPCTHGEGRPGGTTVQDPRWCPSPPGAPPPPLCGCLLLLATASGVIAGPLGATMGRTAPPHNKTN